MPFDWNKNSFHLAGLWPENTAPTQIDLYGFCQMSCGFCFANLNKRANGRELHLKNETAALFRKLERCLADPLDPLGWHLREGYYCAFSNTTDPFQRAEKEHRSSQAVLQWAAARGVNLYLQTRGNVLYEDWPLYRPLLVGQKHAAYVSLCSLDDRLRRTLEPGALPVSERLELVERLAKIGLPVTLAANPYVPDWQPDVDAYCREAKNRGVSEVFVFGLHFTEKQAAEVPAFYKEEVAKANLLPCFWRPVLERWYEAAEKYGLELWPAEFWDATFGYPNGYSWQSQTPLQGKTFQYFHDFCRTLSQLSQEHGNVPVLFSWPQIEAFLRWRGLANPELVTSIFWDAVEHSHRAREQWNAGVPKVAPLYEVLRWLFNHPWLCQNFVWCDPHVRALYDRHTGQYPSAGAEGNLVGIWLPSLKQEDSLVLEISDFDFPAAVWPIYPEEVPNGTVHNSVGETVSPALEA